MKLQWTSSMGTISYVANGEKYSYNIAFSPSRKEWVVCKFEDGRFIRMHRAFTLTGAMARAQVWEDQ